jgi:hypothetical protein
LNNRYVRNAVPVYPAIPEREEALRYQINNIGSGEYSIYRGVLVFWDDDYDSRVLTSIDDNEMLIPNILAVSESKAFLDVMWLDNVPDFPKEVAGVNEKLPGIVEVAGDSWRVESHQTSSQTWLPVLKAYVLKVL